MLRSCRGYLHYGHSNNSAVHCPLRHAYSAAVELDRPAVERVLRRAGELAAPDQHDTGVPHAISEAALLAAAAEVGLDPAVVRVSLAIERLGPQSTPTRADRLLGPGEVVVERVMGVDATAAMERLDDLMVRGHHLRTRRSRPSTREWGKRGGPVGAAQRAAKSAVGDTGLSKVARLQASVSEIDGQRSVLRVVADRHGQRSGVVAATAVVGGIGASGAAVAAVFVSPLLLVAAPLAMGAAAGVARQGRKQAAALADEIDAALDAVEHGMPPVTLTDSLRRAFNSPRQR